MHSLNYLPKNSTGFYCLLASATLVPNKNRIIVKVDIKTQNKLMIERINQLKQESACDLVRGLAPAKIICTIMTPKASGYV